MLQGDPWSWVPWKPARHTSSPLHVCSADANNSEEQILMRAFVLLCSSTQTWKSSNWDRERSGPKQIYQMLERTIRTRATESSEENPMRRLFGLTIKWDMHAVQPRSHLEIQGVRGFDPPRLLNLPHERNLRVLVLLPIHHSTCTQFGIIRCPGVRALWAPIMGLIVTTDASENGASSSHNHQ